MVRNGRKGKEIGRLAKGLSLIAKEFAKRSPTLQSAKNGDFEALLKNAVVSATDLSGLTKGTLSQFTDNPPHSAITTDNNADSVVYFTHDESPLPQMPLAPEQPPQEEQPQATNAASSTSTVEVEPLDSTGQQQFEQQPQPPPPPLPRRKPRERRVPSTPFSRALGFAGLGAGLAWGTLQESTKRLIYGTPQNSPGNQSAVSPFLSPQNAERLALALCRMRGAALKLGQMLSIQDESLVPAPILAALDIVRQGADVMPRAQLNQVLDAELGQLQSWT